MDEIAQIETDPFFPNIVREETLVWTARVLEHFCPVLARKLSSALNQTPLLMSPHLHSSGSGRPRFIRVNLSAEEITTIFNSLEQVKRAGMAQTPGGWSEQVENAARIQAGWNRYFNFYHLPLPIWK